MPPAQPCRAGPGDCPFCWQLLQLKGQFQDWRCDHSQVPHDHPCRGGPGLQASHACLEGRLNSTTLLRLCLSLLPVHSSAKQRCPLLACCGLGAPACSPTILCSRHWWAYCFLHKHACRQVLVKGLMTLAHAAFYYTMVVGTELVRDYMQSALDVSASGCDDGTLFDGRTD